MINKGLPTVTVLSKIVVLKSDERQPVQLKVVKCFVIKRFYFSCPRRAADFSLNIGYENYEDKINDFFFSPCGWASSDRITKNK